MKNRIPGNPGRYSAVIPSEEVTKLQSGQPFAITLTRNDNPVEEGTPYSKETVLPDTVAEELCPNKPNPTPADAFASLAKVKTAVGNKEEVFGATGFLPIIDGGYINIDNEEITKSGCWAYYITGPDLSKFAGRALTIRTYMYGDMALHTVLNMGFNVYTNDYANVEHDPATGIYEITISIPEDINQDQDSITVSFCENQYFDKPVMFEPTGTVWQEIKNLKDFGGGGGSGGGSVDNTVLYEHINNKNNPHNVTASQIGAATTAYVEETVVATVRSEFSNQKEPLIEEVTEKVLESIEIPEGGGITEEQLAETLEGYATINYVETNLPPIINSEIEQQIPYITAQVIAALPIYEGEG